MTGAIPVRSGTVAGRVLTRWGSLVRFQQDAPTIPLADGRGCALVARVSERNSSARACQGGATVGRGNRARAQEEIAMPSTGISATKNIVFVYGGFLCGPRLGGRDKNL